MPRYTDEQTTVIEAAPTGASLKVAAFAGAGKTTTLLGLAERLAPPRGAGRRETVLYLAFNKRLKEEVEQKVRDRRLGHVKVMTCHGLAWRHTARSMTARVDGGSLLRQRAALSRAMPHVTSALIQMGFEAEQGWLALLETVRNFTLSAEPIVQDAHLPQEIRAQAILLGTELPARLVRLATELWLVMTAPGATVPISHDVYLKLFQLRRPTLDYPTVLFDEAQDANPAMLAILQAQPAQTIVVGDPHQQLYAWRGAVNAMDQVAYRELALTQSWRFGPHLAALATTLLQTFKGETRAVRGAPGTDTVVVTEESSVPPDVILVRTNVGALQEILAAMAVGQRVAVVGGAHELAATLEAAWRLRQGQRPGHGEFGLFRNWEQLVTLCEKHAVIRNQYGPYVRMVEEYSEAIPSIGEQLRAETVAEEVADVTVSTVHKAKGREWPSVQLGRDFERVKLAEPADRTILIHEDEVNVAYVAVTRASQRLTLGSFAGALTTALDLVRGEALSDPKT